MIGQRVLVEKIRAQVERGKFPRFSIIIGESGSGKKALAKEVAQMLGIACTIVNNSVEQIRFVIENSYKLDSPILYIIPDCDNMSGAAANALLKVTEEPPKDAYFVCTCENEENLLQTIRSRGVTYMLEPYTYEDKCDYIKFAYPNINNELMEFVLDVTSTPGEINTLLSLDAMEFKKFVLLVVENIAEVDGSNAFKIGDRIAFKDEPDKYNLYLFFRVFNSICVEKMYESSEPLMFARAIAITGDYLQQLNIKGINKQMLFDQWLLAIRKEWL